MAGSDGQMQREWGSSIHYFRTVTGYDVASTFKLKGSDRLGGVSKVSRGLKRAWSYCKRIVLGIQVIKQ